MIVYLDIVILSMVFTDSFILNTIALVLKEKISILRIGLAVLISIIGLTLFLFPLRHFFILRYFVGIIIVLFAYKFKNIKTFIIEVVMYYMLNIAFIGTIVTFRVNNIAMLIISLFLVIISKIVENYKSIIICENELIQKVKINNVNLSAYFDTGNMAYYKGIPVVFISDKFFNNLNFKKIGSLDIHTIDSISQASIYLGPPLYINHTTQIVYYCFQQNLKYDLILHRDCKS